MELKELERKSGYYHGYMILEDCVENGEIIFDKALKKILENNFACGEGDWWEGIDLKDEPEIFVSSEGQSTAEELESLIKFIKLLLEGAKEENSATYNENKNVFDEIIEDCENYSIIELGCNEMFSIKIL